MNDLVSNLGKYKDLCENDSRIVEFKREAEQNLAKIAINIQETVEAIEKAKEISREADKIKTGLFRFGNTDKKADLTAKGLMQTNEAMEQLTKIVQDTINLTQGSIEYTKTAVGIVGFIIQQGFVEVNGQQIRLSNSSLEQFKIIYNASNDFIQNLIAQENHLKLQNEKIAKNSKRLDEKDILDDKQSKDIKANTLNISANKVRLDKKDSLDTEQSRQIAKLESEISKLKNNGLISIVSLIVSVLALGIAIFTLTKIL